MLNDPESYEFGELKLIDSILYKDNIEYRKEEFQHDIDFQKRLLDINDEEWAKTQKALFGKIDSTNILEYLNKIENYKTILLKIDSLEDVLGGRKMT